MQTLQADAFRWSADQDGQWLMIRSKVAMDILKGLDPQKQYDVTIKEHRNRRSLDANAYFWTLLDRLAEAVQISKTELYRNYIKEIGGNNETVCVLEKAADILVSGWQRNGVGWVAEKLPSKLPGCVNVILYYGSSEYDTAQMSRLIDMVVQDCREQRIETLPPDKLAGMMEEWGR